MFYRGVDLRRFSSATIQCSVMRSVRPRRHSRPFADLPSRLIPVSCPAVTLQLAEAAKALDLTPSFMARNAQATYRLLTGHSFKQGATVVPRFLFVVHASRPGGFGPNIDGPSVKSRRSNLEKMPWKNLDPLNGPIESEFLRPLYLGESFAPYRLLEPVEAIIPWDAASLAVDRFRSGTRLANYQPFGTLAGTSGRNLGRESARSRTVIDSTRLDIYGKLSAQFPIAPFRVIYSASGNIPAAAILQGSAAPSSSTSYTGLRDYSAAKAGTMLAILNSES